MGWSELFSKLIHKLVTFPLRFEAIGYFESGEEKLRQGNVPDAMLGCIQATYTLKHYFSALS